MSDKCANEDCQLSAAKTPQAVTGDRIGLQVLKALGLPTEGVTSFSVSFEPKEIVIATVKVVVDKSRLEQVCETYLARMKVCPEFSEPESASLAAQSKSPAPIDQQRLGALIRILRGTEDGARDWLAFGLDPFLAPSANTRARLLDAAEAYLRGLAGGLEQQRAGSSDPTHHGVRSGASVRWR